MLEFCVYQAYYAVSFFEGETDEHLLTAGGGKRIVGVAVGGKDAFGMLGYAYFDRAFSQGVARDLGTAMPRYSVGPLVKRCTV